MRPRFGARDGLVLLCRLALGVVFVVAAWPKVLDPHLFAQAVANYRILPGPTSAFVVAATLPFVELFAGAMLVVGYRLRASGGVCMLISLVFLGAMISAVVRGLDIGCGCFDPSGAGTIGPWQLARGTMFVLAALAVVCLGHDALSLDRALARRTTHVPADDTPPSAAGYTRTSL